MTTPKLGMAGTISQNVGTMENPVWEPLTFPAGSLRFEGADPDKMTFANMPLAPIEMEFTFTFDPVFSRLWGKELAAHRRWLRKRRRRYEHQKRKQ